MAKKEPIRIIVDTREQTPLCFDDFKGVEAIRGTVHTGDYTLAGFETSFAVERKSLDDLVGTLIHDYEADTRKPLKRFNRELLRLSHFDFAAVVVPSQLSDVWSHRYRSLAEPKSVYGLMLSVWAGYGVPFWFAGSTYEAARFVADMAKHYVAAREKKWFLPSKDEIANEIIDF